ncbi:MAG: transcriptional repressor [Candidatus Omnitrophica bacterium]|nr:transcriptional repressor [Candidatus Omnitrophota bacterium]
MPYHLGFGPLHRYGFYKRYGFRTTQARQVILDVFYNCKEHLSAEDIYLKIHKKYPGISLTTVYRTLEILNRLGIIEKHDFGDGRARYELAHHLCKKGHHHHLVCSGCGKVIDYDDLVDKETDFIKTIEEHLSKRYRFKITGHLVQFFGMCPECSKKGK